MRWGWLVLSCALPLTALADRPAEPPALSLEAILEKVRSEAEAAGAIDARREAEFLAEKSRREALLAEARAALREERQRGESLKSRFQANRQAIARLKKRLHEESGDLTELFGVARQSARDARGLLQDSLVSAEAPRRLAVLDQVADAKRLPSVESLRGLWLALLEEVVRSGQVNRFSTSVVNSAGEEVERGVVRVGTFVALSSEGRYLRYLPASQRLVELGRQPQQPVLALARAWLAAAPGEVAPLAVDPTRGELLAVLVRQPGAWARIQEGGVVAYLILVVGALALLIALERAWALWRIGVKVRRQKQCQDRPNGDNPLGRILAAAQQRTLDAQALELKLEEAISRELPRLERGLPTIAILAAVAPLLGLLGTVAGMIDTFQAITLFGTNDPKYLSGGISQALVTTELGLAVAIPVLLIHAWLSGRGESLAQVLDQEAAGMVARRAEEGGDA